MGFSGSLALSEAFSLFKSRIGPMLAVSLLYYVLLGVVFSLFGASLFSQMMTMAPGAAPPAGLGLGILFLYVLVYALQFFQQSALCRLCSDRHEPSIGDAVSTGVRSIPTLFGVAILLLIALFGIIMVLSLVSAAVMAGANSPALGFILGLVMLGGFGYLGMRLSMILPVVANEDQRNPITAISRSWGLTRGNALKLFGLFFLAFLVMFLIAMAIFFLTIGIPQPGMVPGGAGMVMFIVLFLIFGLTVGIYFVTLIAAIHRQLVGPGVANVQETFS